MSAEPESEPAPPVAPPDGWRRPARVLRHMAEYVIRRRTGDPPRLVFNPVGGHHERHTMAPEMYDAPHVLRQRIDDLARSGALDEGNGNVCDDLINLWVEQWCDEVQDEYDDRLIELRLRVAEAEAEVRRRDYLVERAEAELRRSETRYDQLNREFQMPDPPAVPRRRLGRSEKR
ncbi:hypothetical protein AB0J83_33880 [Actinoplanes sp. NPDC049596]|uniref:hypothetical protein n=1 Tax=unclassified Actinoplanes TaxID=2626549 RepID=UPI003441ED38